MVCKIIFLYGEGGGEGGDDSLVVYIQIDLILFRANYVPLNLFF